MVDDLIFEVHCVTPCGREAYCGNSAVADVTRDLKRVTCGDCQAAEAFREEADLLHFAETTPESRETEPDTIIWLRQMRSSQQRGQRDGVLVDGVTADVVLTVYEASAREDVKVKIVALSMPRVAVGRTSICVHLTTLDTRPSLNFEAERVREAERDR